MGCTDLDRTRCSKLEIWMLILRKKEDGNELSSKHYQLFPSGKFYKSLDHQTLDNWGTVTWNATNIPELMGYGDSLFSNHGQFIIQTNCLLTGSASFDNASGGTVRNLAASTEIDWPFTNSGTLDLPTGALT